MGLREKRKLERRERILTAAQQLIRETGSVGLSMRSLADRAEVSLATPYNLFGSKGAVLAELGLAVLKKLEIKMEELHSRDPIEDLLHIAELGANTYASDPRFYRTLMGVLTASARGLHDDAISGGSVRLWQRPVEAGIHAGLLRADADSEFVARDLVITFLGVLDLWVRGVLDGDAMRTQILYAFALVLLGLSTDASRPRLLRHYHRFQRQLPREIHVVENAVPARNGNSAPAAGNGGATRNRKVRAVHAALPGEMQ
jgi:AcrR family transcriptional regulator